MKFELILGIFGCPALLLINVALLLALLCDFGS
jgi:hypothetical protein